MRVLIFGGAGLIGTALTKKFLSEGNEVIVIDNLSTGTEPVAHPQLTYIKLDITTPLSQWTTIPNGIDLIYHLAFPTALCDRKIENQYVEVCTIGMLNILEFARKSCQKIIYGSSISVYGDAKTLPISEKTNTNPILLYGVHKLLNEQYLQLYHTNYNIQYQIIRISDVFGEGDRRKNAINSFIQNSIAQKNIEINGDGNQVRTCTYHKDIANGLFLVSQKPFTNDTFNLSGDEAITMNELAKKIQNLCSSSNTIIHHVERIDNRNYIFDNHKFIDYFGRFEIFGLEKGLQNLISHYKNHESRNSST